MRFTFKDGDIVVATRFYLQLKLQDIVVLSHPITKKLLVKRIREIKEGEFFVVGDNEKESTDSRQFGWIGRKDIVGKVFSTPRVENVLFLC